MRNHGFVPDFPTRQPAPRIELHETCETEATWVRHKRLFLRVIQFPAQSISRIYKSRRSSEKGPSLS